MDQEELSKANRLNREYDQLAHALRLLDQGAPVTGVTIAGLTVPVSSLPDKVVADIKAALVAQRQSGISELGKLGITGFGQQQRQQQQPQPARAAQPAVKQTPREKVAAAKAAAQQQPPRR